MGIYGTTKTWKVVYYPKDSVAGRRGVALVEGVTRQDAMYAFSQEYAGEYTTVLDCDEIG